MPPEKIKSHRTKIIGLTLLMLILIGGLGAFYMKKSEKIVLPLMPPKQPEMILPLEQEPEQVIVKVPDIPVLKSVIEVEVETKPLVASQLTEYALKLHDDLLTNHNCLDTWQALQTEPFPVALLIQLEPYCWDSFPMNGVYQAFAKGAQMLPKKNSSLTSQGIWTRIKTALWPFHKIQNSSKDFVAQASEALEQKDIALAIHLIKQMDNTEQQQFKDFFIKAHLYEQAQKNLDTYLLSF